MSPDIETELRQEASNASAFHAACPIPNLPTSIDQSATQRTQLRRVLVAAAATVLVIAVIAVVRIGDRQAIAPAAPVPTTPAAPEPDGATNGATNPSVSATTATAATTETTADPGIAVPGSDPGGGRAPTEAELEAEFATLGSIPEGYRVVAAGIQPQVEQPTSTDGGWTATYASDLVSGQPLSHVQVSVISVTADDQLNSADDPYNGLPTIGPDLHLGSFTGRWIDFTQFPGYASFAAPLDHGWLLVVGGRATEDEVTSMLSEMHVDPLADPPITGTQPPTGFTLVDEGHSTDQQPRLSSTIVYAQGNAQRTAITITTSIEPAQPAIMTAFGPDLPRTVDINGAVGVLVRGVLTFDVSPTVQVSLTVGGPATWAYSEDIDLLTALAKSVAMVDHQAFGQYQQDALADPFTPTDGDCESYITFSDARSDTGTPGSNGTIDVAAPGTVTVTITSTQPLANLDFFIEGLGKRTPIGHLDTLNTTADVTLTWNGAIDGQPAPAAPYPRIAVRADPADPSAPDACNRHSDEPHMSDYSLTTYDYSGDFAIGATFVVPEA